MCDRGKSSRGSEPSRVIEEHFIGKGQGVPTLLNVGAEIPVVKGACE